MVGFEPQISGFKSDLPTTAPGAKDSSKVVCLQLNINLDKIEALEGKIKAEMVTLKEKMSKMEEDLATYSDLVWSVIPT